jgi:hypothetical protein
VIEPILNRFAVFDRENGAIFSAEELEEYPPETIDSLKGARLLTRAGYRKTVECDGCEQACFVSVFQSRRLEHGVPPRFFIACEEREEVGRIPVSPATLEQWQIDIYQFVQLLTSTLGVKAEPEEIIPRQVFNLGSLTLKRKVRTLIFVANQQIFQANLGNDAVQGANPVFLIGAGQMGVENIAGGFAIPLASILIDPETGINVDVEGLSALLSSSNKQAKRSDLVPLRPPKGTKWSQVIITFIDQETVQIKAPEFGETRRFDSMGFADGRKQSTPSQLWEIFRVLAQFNGELNYTESSQSFSDPEKLKSWVSQIRKKLQAAFPNISGDPFLPYKTSHGYKTRFSFQALPASK